MELISKTNISNILEISFSWKGSEVIVFVVSSIQLPSSRCAWYGFNVPIFDLQSKQKYEHD